jgi:uncharacterized protein YbgA (DUF1722 family)/uncharacterized protein YbbK (DUF523 family)
MHVAETAMKRVKLGVSACLIGEKTRYDGQDKMDPLLTETMGRHVEFVPVCPEVECGLGVPREPMRLEKGVDGCVRLIVVKTGKDMTPLMERVSSDIIVQLGTEALWGFIFKSRSPSCGPLAPVQGFGGAAKGSGVFVRMWGDHFPLLPLEDEARLWVPEVRERFVRRLFALKRWRELAAGMDRARLLDFHTRHKLLVLSHSESHYREMGRLLARAGAHTIEDLSSMYGRLLFDALRRRTTIKKHVNVLDHARGYFRKQCTPGERREMEERVNAFGAGLAPLLVPLVCLSLYARRYEVSYLADQYYINPEPAELMLLCHS